MQLISKCILLNTFSLILTKPQKAFVPLFCIHWNQVFTSILISLDQVTQNLNLSLMDSEAHAVFPPLPPCPKGLYSFKTFSSLIFVYDAFCYTFYLSLPLWFLSFAFRILSVLSRHNDIPIYFLLKNVSFAVHILCFYIFPHGKPTVLAPYVKYLHPFPTDR